MATVQGILADVNIQGHVDFLVVLLRSGTWGAIWRELNLRYAHFGELGLDPRSKDSAVWQACQDLGYVLTTSNRNESGIDSLETTIRQRNTADSLPVLTVSDAQRFH